MTELGGISFASLSLNSSSTSSLTVAAGEKEERKKLRKNRVERLNHENESQPIHSQVSDSSFLFRFFCFPTNSITLVSLIKEGRAGQQQVIESIARLNRRRKKDNEIVSSIRVNSDSAEASRRIGNFELYIKIDHTI